MFALAAIQPCWPAPLPANATGLLHAIKAIPMTWRIDRRAAGSDDMKSCILATWRGAVTLRLQAVGAGAVWTVTIGVDSEPKSLRYLRVNRKIFTSQDPSFVGGEAADIVARLKEPGEIAFEWAERGTHAKRQGLVGIGDFAVKAAACETWVKGAPV